MIAEWIDPKYLDEKIISDLQWKFIDNKPFPHLFIENFLKKEVLTRLSKELAKEKFFEKEADLFQFKQTKDFSGVNSNFLKKFYSFLSSKEFSEFISKLTGIRIKQGALDVSGTLYEDTDYLLCHDDQVSDRKIAYIFYLGEDFNEIDGGSFNLISEIRGKADKVVKKYYPKFNGFMIFEVSERSFHEVEEVIGKNKRYAIGGWLR